MLALFTFKPHVGLQITDEKTRKQLDLLVAIEGHFLSSQTN